MNGALQRDNKILEINNTGTYFTTIIPVWLSSKKNPTQEISCYALLDNVSNKSFFLSDVYEQLDSDYFETNLKLGTMVSRYTTVATKGSTDLQIRPYHDTSMIISLPLTYTRNSIPADKSCIPNPMTIAKWPHLAHIASKIPDRLNCPISLLLSYKYVQTFLLRKVIAGGDNQPFACKSNLNWLVIGLSCNYEVDCDNIGMTHRMIAFPLDIVGANEMQSGSSVPTQSTTRSHSIYQMY